MVQINEYQGNPFEPALTYEMDFDPEKKAPMANLMVEYTKSMEVEDSTVQGGFREMTRMMQTKETIRKFQGISAEELLYTSDEFRVKARDMDMEPVQMWKDWPKCLAHTPRKVWDRMLIVEEPFNQTQSGLNAAI